MKDSEELAKDAGGRNWDAVHDEVASASGLALHFFHFVDKLCVLPSGREISDGK